VAQHNASDNSAKTRSHRGGDCDSAYALRRQMVEQAQYLEAQGLNELSSGNISCRFGEGMLITPAGARAATMAPEAIVAVSDSGIWPQGLTPSSEWQMHRAIYRAKSSAQAVVHTHSDHCVALACQQQALPGFHYLVGSFGGTDVPCVPYYTFGTEQLAAAAAAALQQRSACLLASHGMVSRAGDLVQAVQLAHRLEIMCRQYLLSRQLGEPELLTATQWQQYFTQSEQLNYGAAV
jgi:L-fuculose-phosphate aldolase